ncbi:PilZ domain-containing protein [Oceanisphaera avium]|uniref:PilZ domain-containing protein n=1 Tax=Oceanisphaera avium TaxID=1903694 RepID=A0A1Y0CXD8_9GAMM|nr:PilZ domain-containing protein [Oceanisphaera avium]ART80001.1 hypothetical protein CBP12_07460 [Oceanisphaera avium]
MDLSAYKTLINKLVTLSYQYDLEHLVDDLVPDANEELRFQLQAEVRRLTTPCLRVLDLRSLFGAQCQLVRHQGLDHQMPASLAARFQRLLQHFNGEYTRGLYEALLAELAALRKLPAQFNTCPWQLPALGLQRKESRLRFVTPLCLHLPNQQTLAGNSLDISPTGLLVQLQANLSLPSELAVSFPDLSKQAGLACLAQPKRYRVSQAQTEKGRVKLQRMEEDNEWHHALSQFIEQQRPRYGLDAEDLYSSVKAQCWSQTMLETSISLALFFNDCGELQHLLTNRRNEKILATWQQQTPGDLLSTLLSPARILSMGQHPQTPGVLYSFRLPNQSQIFVASQEQLDTDHTFSAFVQAGLAANSLTCYYLSLRSLTVADQDVVLDNQGLRQLQQLAWQLWLTPIPAPQLAQGVSCELNQLSRYLVSLSSHKAITAPLGRQGSKRQEARFKLRSAIELTIGNQVISAVTEDLSAHGIKAVLNQAIRLDIPCMAQVSLTELNKRSRQWKLKGLAYRVVNLSEHGTIVHLQIAGSEESHNGFHFFNALLAQNQDKLRAKPETFHTSSWANWLTQQALQQPPSPSFLLARNDGGFYVQGALACLEQPALMAYLSNNYQQAHLSKLLSRQQWQSIYSQLLRPDGRSHHSYEIWTANAADNPQQSWLLLNPEPKRQAFLLDARHSQQLSVTLVLIHRVQLRQLECFVPQWNRLAQTSLHKTQQLEQQLAELCALSQVFDITDIARSRQRH